MSKVTEGTPVAVQKGLHVVQHQLLCALVLLICHPDQKDVTAVHLQPEQGARQAGQGDQQQVSHVQAQAMQVGDLWNTTLRKAVSLSWGC